MSETLNVADEMRRYMESGAKPPAAVIAKWRALINKLDALGYEAAKPAAEDDEDPDVLYDQPLEAIVNVVSAEGEAVRLYRWRVKGEAKWHPGWFEGPLPDGDDIETETRIIATPPAPATVEVREAVKLCDAKADYLEGLNGRIDRDDAIRILRGLSSDIAALAAPATDGEGR